MIHLLLIASTAAVLGYVDQCFAVICLYKFEISLMAEEYVITVFIRRYHHGSYQKVSDREEISREALILVQKLLRSTHYLYTVRILPFPCRDQKIH